MGPFQKLLQQHVQSAIFARAIAVNKQTLLDDFLCEDKFNVVKQLFFNILNQLPSFILLKKNT